jgi:hypothetical protein
MRSGVIEIQRWTAAVLATLIVAESCSCAHYVEMPKDPSSTVSAEEAEPWRIETKDRTVFLVSRFTVTDSTLVIEAIEPAVESPTLGHQLATILPYTIALKDIRSIKRPISEDEANTTRQFVAVGVIIAGLVALLLVIGHSLEFTD